MYIELKVVGFRPHGDTDLGIVQWLVILYYMSIPFFFFFSLYTLFFLAILQKGQELILS